MCVPPDAPGLVFPDELPKDYYSPGKFFVERNVDNKYYQQYEFDAMLNGEVHKVTLQTAHNDTFKATAEEIGDFNFKTMRVHYLYNRYLGNKGFMKQHGTLSMLVPNDRDALERACIEQDFFFIGYIGKQDLQAKR